VSDSVEINESARVPPELAGARLDRVAAVLFDAYSRARLQRWIKDGSLTVDGARRAPRERMLGGERLALAAVSAPSERWVAQPVPVEVVHADEALIIVDKPPGLVVHPGAGRPDRTLVNGLLRAFPELAALPRAGIVHRLDRDTSGLMVVARSLASHHRLVEQLQAHAVGRRYQALVEGTVTGGFTVDAPIGRDPHNRLRQAVVPDGRAAITHVRLAQRFAAHTLLRCRLETGRTHQIRVHLAQRGYPIVGDRLYGARGRLPQRPEPELAERLRGFGRQALHAERLELAHPLTGEALAFAAPLPDDMAALLAALAEHARARGLARAHPSCDRRRT